MQSIFPVILSGDGGTRLWPISSHDTPKQFLPLLTDQKSLFEQALDRVSDRSRFKSPIVVASLKHARTCADLMAQHHRDGTLILEPCARNTAPAILMAASFVRQRHGDDALLLVMPSDHLIQANDEFQRAISLGEIAAQAGYLVTFGVRPEGPETAYGYLEAVDDVPRLPGIKKVAKFVEKPTLEVAKRMVRDASHLWNAGIFLFRAGAILDEAMEFAPEIARGAMAAIGAATSDGISIIPDEKLLRSCPGESIDYAVMEHSERIAAVPMSPGWSDLGSWDALAQVSGTEQLIGPITALECDGCYIRSDGVEVAALGVRDLIVVASAGRLLILPRGRSQEVKTLLSFMESMAA